MLRVRFWGWEEGERREKRKEKKQEEEGERKDIDTWGTVALAADIVFGSLQTLGLLLIIQLPWFFCRKKKSCFVRRRISCILALACSWLIAFWLFPNDSFHHVSRKTIKMYIFIMWRYCLKFECQAASWNYFKAYVYINLCMCICAGYMCTFFIYVWYVCAYNSLLLPTSAIGSQCHTL